jgi:hypothetical protein
MNPTLPAKTITLSSGRRKYTTLWQAIIANGTKPTLVKCDRVDTITVMNGVKKEKVKDKRKPKDKILICEPTEFGVEFKLVEDTSVNNI